MEKFPFTSLGFDQLQHALYALTNPELEMEAALVREHFDTWISQHFDLTESQLLFLAAIDPKLKAFLAFETSFAMGNRLPILLLKTSTASTPEEEQGKIIRPKSTLAAAWGNEMTFHASGTLVIEILYGT
ncbi:hypothetical protein [Pedobacter helvus]|uniref:Uncharacterized protein n=1 Tax=Pedobacter helvus TaxID=2563444 RepID=A0ABW9JIP1_9SPHI|nr:hypothetical protein [Pedobacter ureilyticus]